MTNSSYPSWLREGSRKSWANPEPWVQDYINHLENELNKLLKEDEALDQFSCPHLTDKDFFKRGLRYQLRKTIKLLKDRNR